jgi:hypothetical protein
MVNACGKGGDHSVDDGGYHYTNGDERHSLYPRIRGDKYGATYTYERGDLEVYGGGSVNSKRDWEAEVGIEYRFRRSAQLVLKLFTLIIFYYQNMYILLVERANLLVFNNIYFKR